MKSEQNDFSEEKKLNTQASMYPKIQWFNVMDFSYVPFIFNKTSTDYHSLFKFLSSYIQQMQSESVKTGDTANIGKKTNMRLHYYVSV